MPSSQISGVVHGAYADERRIPDNAYEEISIFTAVAVISHLIELPANAGVVQIGADIREISAIIGADVIQSKINSEFLQLYVVYRIGRRNSDFSDIAIVTGPEG